MNHAKRSAPSLLAAAVLCGACYTHAPHPGLVTVTEYTRVDRVEVTLDDLRVRASSGRDVWVSLDGVREGQVCAPVRADVRWDDGTLVSEWSFVGVADRPYVDADGASRADAAAVSAWSTHEPPTLDVDGDPVRLRDEHIFNLHGFVAELGCGP